MTSRARVLQASAHKPTDRASADYGAHPQVTDVLTRETGGYILAMYDENQRQIQPTSAGAVANRVAPTK